MTLGGMALAVGILVDDATVELENVHRNIAMKKPLRRAILDGAARSRARVRLHARHLHRLRAGRVPDRSGRLFVHAAGPGRRLRHVGLLFPLRTLVPTMVLYLLGQGQGRRKSERGRLRTVSPQRYPSDNVGFHRAFNRGFSGCPRYAESQLGTRSPPRHAGRPARLRDRLVGTISPPWPGLLPRRGRRPVPHARPGSGRDPHRGDRADLRPGRGCHPRVVPVVNGP